MERVESRAQPAEAVALALLDHNKPGALALWITNKTGVSMVARLFPLAHELRPTSIHNPHLSLMIGKSRADSDSFQKLHRCTEYLAAET